MRASFKIAAVALALLAFPSVKASEDFFEVDGLQVEAKALTNYPQSTFFSGSFLASARGAGAPLTIEGRAGLKKFYKKTVFIRPGSKELVRVYAPFGGLIEEFQIYNSFNDRKWTGMVDFGVPEKAGDCDLPSDSELMTWRDFCGIAAELRMDEDRWRGLDEASKEAVLDWVFLGGNLAIEGRKALREEILIEHPFPIFERSPKANNEYGRGTLRVEEKLKSDANNKHASKLSIHSEFQDISPSWEIRKIAPLPFVAAIAIFGLLIGPGVIIISHMSGRPGLCLVLIPAISLVACLALIVLALLGDGVTPKLCKQSSSFLDQRSGKVWTQELFGVEAPVGLLKAPSLPENYLVAPGSVNSLNGGCFIVENGRLHFSGMVLPRTPAFFRSCKFEIRRERLELIETDGELKAKNNLGGALKSLVVCDSKGALWSCGELADGAMAKLSPGFEGTCYAGFSSLSIGADRPRSQGALAPGCYQAELAEDLFGDEFVKGARKAGDEFHYLIGRL